jgi:uncharacterized protein YjbJ (UPF0337 family)
MSGAGYGSTGGNRDTAGMNAGTTGSKAMGDRAGSGEVHSGLHSGGQRDEYSGIAFSGSASGQGESGVRDKVAGAARGAAGSVRDQAGNLGGKAGDAASGARDRLSGLSERAGSLLEGRGIVGRLQENPLPALGVAFAVGFLVAGGTNQSRPDSPAARARNELRNALMAGLSSGVAQGARGFLDTAGRPEGVANSMLRTLLSNVLGGAQQGGGQGGSAQGGAARSSGQQGGGRMGGGGGGATSGGRTGGAGRGGSQY